MTLIVEAMLVTAGVLIAIGVVNCTLLTCAVGTAMVCDGKIGAQRTGHRLRSLERGRGSVTGSTQSTLEQKNL